VKCPEASLRVIIGKIREKRERRREGEEMCVDANGRELCGEISSNESEEGELE